ncbi:hypothetical protein QWA68_015093 [Fusarium oxysporum]|nr:hypothetical protein QWA68_015093 [Fusarium oxysporum]
MPSVLPSLRELNSENPDSFRSILLIAALYFAWRSGKLGVYERTYLYHKVKSIESVNKHLNGLSRKGALTCMSTVATLCMVEGSMGNLYEAEAHLDGLLAMLDAVPSDSDQVVTLQHYIVICMREIMEWKRVVCDDKLYSRFSVSRNDDCERSWMPLHVWTNIDKGAVEERLEALFHIPQYITVSRPVTQEIDARGAIKGLRLLTAGKIPSQYVNVGHLWYVLGGQASLVPFSEQPPSSTSRSQEQDPELRSDWLGLALAIGLYMHGTLRQWDSWQAMEGRALRWVISVVEADLNQTQAAMVSGAVNQELWLWKSFAMGFAVKSASRLAKRQGRIDQFILGGDATVQALQQSTAQRIRLWSSVTSQYSWTQAKASLSRIVWPAKVLDENLDQMLWESALQSSPIADPYGRY